MAVKKVGFTAASKISQAATLDPKLLAEARIRVATGDKFIRFGYKTGDQATIGIGDHDLGFTPSGGTIPVPTVRSPTPGPPPRIDPLLQLNLLDTIDVAGTEMAVEVYVRFVPKQRR